MPALRFPRSWRHQAVSDAIRALGPLTPPVPLFGLVFGLAVAESPVVDPFAGWASSVLVFGGASQLAALVVLDAGGTALVAIGTILVINARHVMYSAALRPRFADAPRWFRWVGPYLLVDQLFAIIEPRPDDDPLDYRIVHYLVGGMYWLVWWLGSVGAGVVLGVTAGDVIPDGWSLEFSVPLLFLGLLVNAIRDRPGLAAAVTAGSVAVAARNLQPAGTGLLLAAMAGLAVGAAVDRLTGQANPSPDTDPSAASDENGRSDGIDSRDQPSGPDRLDKVEEGCR